MALLDDFEAEYSKPKNNSLINDFESSYKPPKSFKDKVYDVANSLFSNDVSVVKGMDGTQQTANTGFNDIPLSKVLQENAQPNNLQAGSKIVDGLSGIAEVGARKGYAGIGRIEAGALKILADVLNSDALSNTAKSQQDYARSIENGAVLRGKPIEGFARESIVQDLPQAASNAIGSFITTAPSLVAGAIAPGLTFPAMFATSGAQEYGQGRESGLNPAGAALRAIPQAALEVVGEKVGGTGQLADALHAAVKGNGVAGLGSAMIGSALKELPGEELTTTGQFLVDKAPGIGTNQEAGLNEYGQQVKDTALATLLQSGAMAAGGKALSSIQPTPQTAPLPQSVPEASPAPQVDTTSVLDAINKANELTKQRLTISNGTEDTSSSDDALAAQKQAEYDAQQTTPTNNLLAEFENEQSRNPAALVADSLPLESNNGSGSVADLPAEPASSGINADSSSPSDTNSLPTDIASTRSNAVSTIKPKKKSGTLLTKLKDLGGVKLSEKLDVTGQDKSFAPGGYNQVFTNKSKASLKGLIEGGGLDAFLPPAMRLETNGMNDAAFDSTEAYDYLADKIRNGEKVISFDAEQEIKFNKYYAEDNASVQSDHDLADAKLTEDEINEQLQLAGYRERETTTQAREFDARNTDRIIAGSERDQAGAQSGGISQAQTDEVTRPEVSAARDIVTQIVKRRAAANQIGKSKPFDTALQLAKDFMNGESVNPNKFKNAAILFKNDPLLSEHFNKLHELAKPQAKVARIEKSNAIDSYKRIISSATSAKELQVIARDIQDDESLTDAQAQALDDIVFEAQDKLSEGDNVSNTEVTTRIEQPKSSTDLLGDNTAAKQAIADAERAKDAKRNSGNDNQDTFNLTGSNSEADQAAAAGAQDLFSQPKKVEGNISDFGEKLEGAKKDLWKNYKKSMSEELPADLSQVTVSKYFPEPDYDNLIASGLDIRAIAAIKAMRDEIPTKPKLKYKLRHWADNLTILRETANSLINGKLSIDKVIDEFRKGKLTPKFVERIELYAELGYPAFKSAKGWSIESGWNDLNKDGKTISLEYPNGNRQMFITREAAIETLRDKLAIEPEGAERKVKLDIYKVTRTGEIVIGKKVASNKYIDLKGGFKTAKEARLYLAENESELLTALEKAKDVRPERRSVNNPRVGTDYRQGDDVTPEKFASEYGFRGVQFGNYVEQSRRNKDLNNAYDALLDLSHIIGIPTKAISLNGSLGLAFGARGKGGKRPAAAHYESSEVVINLTKVNGAGSLGHEWWHSLDNYLSKSRGENNKFVTQNPNANKSYIDGKFVDDASIRPELLAAFKELMKAIKGSDYYTRAAKLDGARSQNYWSTSEELSARAFEAYLITKAKENNNSNDYLANIEDEEVYKVYNEMAKETGDREDPYPYPTADEQKIINPLFDALFNTLKTKETDTGIALFNSKEVDDRPAINKQSLDRVIATISARQPSSKTIIVAPTFDSLPSEIVAYAEKTGYDNTKERITAVAYKKNIYLVQENIRNELEAEESIIHEHIHDVLQSQGKDSLVDAMNALYERVGRGEGLLRIANKVGYKFDNYRKQAATLPERQRIALYVEEFLAGVEGNRAYDSLPARITNAIREFWGSVRAWLKDKGYTNLASKLGADLENFTKSDLAYLLKQVRETTPSGNALDNIRFNRIPIDENTTNKKSFTDLDFANQLIPKSVPYLLGRDALGNINFTAGKRAKDFIHAVSRPLAIKAGMANAPLALQKMMNQQKASMAKAMRAAGDIAETTKNMSVNEANLIGRMIVGEMYHDDVPPEHAIKIAAVVEQMFKDQGERKVELGMLDAAKLEEGNYLPRYYNRSVDPELKGIKNVFKRAFRSNAVQGLNSGSNKGRGQSKVVTVAELSQWQSLGWEVRDKSYEARQAQDKLDLSKNGKPLPDSGNVRIWRDYDQSTRKQMGEIEDFRLRTVLGYISSQRDIALGTMFKQIAENAEFSNHTGGEGFTKVPDTTIAESNVKTYGALSGMYVKDEILSHINKYEANNNEFLKYYKAALSKWKEGKTVLNPVSHMNNFVSNYTMAHLAGVSYWDGEKYLFALKEMSGKSKDNGYVQEAEDAGLFEGGMTQVEFMRNMPPEIRKMADIAEDSPALKTGRFIWKLASLGLNEKAGKLYTLGDSFYKYVIYRDARNKGLSPEDAVIYATDYIFNYDDLPSTARGIRDYGIPFFSYTYKALPRLMDSALEYPWRFAAPATIISTISALTYAALAGDDDDWWLTAALNGSMNAILNAYTFGAYGDKEIITKGEKLEASETKNLPEWDKGRSIFGTQKNLRLGTDEKTGLPVYDNIYRFMPGGDMLDSNNEKGGVGIFAPFMPSSPMFSIYSSIVDNKQWNGKDLVDSNDTNKERAEKYADWAWKFAMPNIAIGGAHFDRLMQSAAQMADTTIETPFKDYTGYGKDGLPVQPKYASLNTIGIKARPIDLELSADIAQGKDGKELSSLKAEARQLARMLDKKAVSQREYDRKLQEILDKAEVIQSKY